MKVVINGVEYVPVNNADIKVGDLVKVVDSGKIYSTYHSWPDWKKVPVEYAVRYSFGQSLCDGKRGVVRYIGTHEFGDVDLALIETIDGTKQCYLIALKGIVKCSEC